MKPWFSTWKSSKSTRPHWLAAAAPTGVLNVEYMRTLPIWLSLMFIQSWVGDTVPGHFVSHRRTLSGICPRIVDAPMLWSHCASARPLGNEVLMKPVWSGGYPLAVLQVYPAGTVFLSHWLTCHSSVPENGASVS